MAQKADQILPTHLPPLKAVATHGTTAADEYFEFLSHICVQFVYAAARSIFFQLQTADFWRPTFQ